MADESVELIDDDQHDNARDDDDEPVYRGRLWGFPPFQKAAASGVFLALGVLLSWLDGPEPFTIVAYFLAAVLGASHWGREAIEQVVKLRVNIDVLMAVATVGAAVLGLWEEAAFLVAFYLLVPNAVNSLKVTIFDVAMTTAT